MKIRFPVALIVIVLVVFGNALFATAQVIIVDDFTSNTLNPNWVQSTTNGSGTYTFDTTTNDNQLTMQRPSLSGSGNPQEFLLRSDVGLNVGETLRADFVSFNSAEFAGISVSAMTGITSQQDVMSVYVKTPAGTFGPGVEVQHYDGGVDLGQTLISTTLTNVADLFIERATTNTFNLGYGSPSGDVVVATLMDSGGSAPGPAIGFIVDIRGSTNGSAVFDNFRITTTIPEPASIAIWSLIGWGLAGFGYYRVRRKN